MRHSWFAACLGILVTVGSVATFGFLVVNYPILTACLFGLAVLVAVGVEVGELYIVDTKWFSVVYTHTHRNS